MATSRFYPVLVLGLIVLLSGCRSGTRDIGEGEDGELLIGQAEVSETTTRGVNPGTRTLVITGFNGNIELTGSDGDTAQLEFTKRARGRNDGAARETLGEIDIEESGGDDAYRFDLTARQTDRSAVDVRGTVPVGTPLRIEMTNGSVAISAADGPIDIDMRNGTVRIGGTTRDVTARVGNGDIDLGTRMVDPNGSIRLEASNGNVSLRMPASASTRVDARTTVGTVRVSGLEFSSRRLQREGAGSSFSGQLGGGNARVEIRVQNGMITLSEGQTHSLDGMQAPMYQTPEMDPGLEPDTVIVDTARVDPVATDTAIVGNP